MNSNTLAASLLCLLFSLSGQAFGETVTLEASFTGTPMADNPTCRFTRVGSNLWFTTQNGGNASFGGVFSFDPVTRDVSKLADLDGTTGNRPWASSLYLAAGKAWFTTSQGGTGSQGSLCSIETNAPYAVANVFSFPTNAALGWKPHSTPILIDNDLWFTTSGGGTPPDGSTTYGAVVRYNLGTGLLTNVLSLDSTNYGRQPLGNSIVKAGNEYYFTTFSGGANVVPIYAPTGGGVINRITFDGSNQPVITKRVDLTAGQTALPAGDPVYDGSNYLYFTTTGPSAAPGSISRYDLTTHQVTNLFSFVSNAVSATLYGKQPYCTPVLFGDNLYFTTFTGGIRNKGTLGKYSISSNIVTKLADFEGYGVGFLGSGPQYNGGTVYTNPVDGRVKIYWPINRGGDHIPNNGVGTIVSVSLPPFPIVSSITNSGGGSYTLSWTGGYPPYSVDVTSSATGGAWITNWLSGISSNSVTISATNTQAYFRIVGQSE